MNTYEELQWKEPPLYTESVEDELLGSLSPTETQTKRTHVPLLAESTALVVVDVQPEYWSNCLSVRKDFPDFPENLRRTIEVCRERRAKLIWVRADYRFSHSPWLVQFARLHHGRSPDMKTEIPCDPHSEDFKWEDFATPEGGEVIIAKTSWSSVSNTALIGHLHGSGIDTVLVCGLITSVCVQHSAFGIFEAGFRTLLVTDACADRGRARHDAALALYGDYMYELMTSHDLEDPCNGLKQAQPVWLVMENMRSAVKRGSIVNKTAQQDENSALSMPRLYSFSRLQEVIAMEQDPSIDLKGMRVKDGADKVHTEAPLSTASSISSLSREGPIS